MHDSLVSTEAFLRPAVSATSLFACNEAIDLVAREKNVPARMLMHRSRCRKRTALARQLAMYLAHVVLGRSLTEIGNAFGRDRTTVSHACARIEDMRDDRAFDEEVSAFERRLEAQRDEASRHAR